MMVFSRTALPHFVRGERGKGGGLLKVLGWLGIGGEG